MSASGRQRTKPALGYRGPGISGCGNACRTVLPSRGGQARGQDLPLVTATASDEGSRAAIASATIRRDAGGAIPWPLEAPRRAEHQAALTHGSYQHAIAAGVIARSGHAQGVHRQAVLAEEEDDKEFGGACGSAGPDWQIRHVAEARSVQPDRRWKHRTGQHAGEMIRPHRAASVQHVCRYPRTGPVSASSGDRQASRPWSPTPSWPAGSGSGTALCRRSELAARRAQAGGVCRREARG